MENWQENIYFVVDNSSLVTCDGLAKSRKFAFCRSQLVEIIEAIFMKRAVKRLFAKPSHNNLDMK